MEVYDYDIFITQMLYVWDAIRYLIQFTWIEQLLSYKLH